MKGKRSGKSYFTNKCQAGSRSKGSGGGGQGGGDDSVGQGGGRGQAQNQNRGRGWGGGQGSGGHGGGGAGHFIRGKGAWGRKSKDDDQAYLMRDVKGRTGANTIEVDWTPAQPQEDELQAALADGFTEGATPKSAPGKPPPPTRGPVGRGRSQILPAWMKPKDSTATIAPPALFDMSAAEDGSTAITVKEANDFALRPAAGRGRGSNTPAWKMQGAAGPGGSAEPASKTISKSEEGRDVTADDAGRPAGKRIPRRLMGGTRGQPAVETDSRSNQHGGGYTSGVRDGEGQDKQSTDCGETQYVWVCRETQYVCALHNMRRNWQRLIVAEDGRLVCRLGAECITYVGGGNDTRSVKDKLSAAPDKSGNDMLSTAPSPPPPPPPPPGHSPLQPQLQPPLHPLQQLSPLQSLQSPPPKTTARDDMLSSDLRRRLRQVQLAAARTAAAATIAAHRRWKAARAGLEGGLAAGLAEAPAAEMLPGEVAAAGASPHTGEE